MAFAILEKGCYRPIIIVPTKEEAERLVNNSRYAKCMVISEVIDASIKAKRRKK